MLENRIKQKMADGQAVYGIYLQWACPDLVEFFGHLGFEWVFIDAEHGIIGRESCADLVRACHVTGMTPVVRVPENNVGTILGYLETGALGIIVPHINTAADARAAVDAVKYAPIGRRGAGSTTRAANYGLTQTPSEYFHQANEAVLVSALVEEIEGVNNLAEILAVEGVDIVGIGPGDLSMSMGLPGQPNHPAVRKLVDAAEARIAASGKTLDAVVTTADQAREAVSRGALMVAMSVASLLSGAGRTFLREVQSTR